jgi:hypothetical protein
VQELERFNTRSASSAALSLEAQLLALSGQLEPALSIARRARAQQQISGDFFGNRALEYFEGLLEGGQAGRQLQEAALAFFSEQGWKKPRRAVAMLCPALDHLEAQT